MDKRALTAAITKDLKDTLSREEIETLSNYLHVVGVHVQKMTKEQGDSFRLAEIREFIYGAISVLKSERPNRSVAAILGEK